MGEQAIPRGIRILDIVVGVTTILTAALIIIGHELARFLLIFAISTSLLGIGVARISRATVLKEKGIYRRIVNLVSGISVAIISFIVVFSPTMIEVQQIQLVSWALLILGVARIMIGILEDDVGKNLRILQFLVGLISIVIAFLLVIFPSTDFLLAISFIALITGLNGMARAARGYIGV